MSIKNIYLFKVIIRDTETNDEVEVSRFNSLFREIFDANSQNSALKLTYENAEPIMLDILENNDEFLFARLNRKRPNNSLQKRNYNTFETTDVLSPDEVAANGVELFTYCILGYSHGILSIVNSKGAPNEGSLSRIFQRFNNRYSLETEGIPNQDLIRELLEGETPEINRVQIDIAQPSAQVLQQLFGFNDNEILQAVSDNSSSLVFEVKPKLRGALINNPNLINRLVDAFRTNHNNYRSVILSGKSESGDRQRQYDLYEEFFKYPISISEYRQENGRKIEVDKLELQSKFRSEMINVYNEYKKLILTVSNR